MLDGLRWQLHKLFDEFIRRHPCFVQSGGSVSLFGHSLGSVMCYDLLHETACVQGLLSPTVPAPPPSGTGAWNNRSVVSVADQTGKTVCSIYFMSCDALWPIRFHLPGHSGRPVSSLATAEAAGG